MEKLAEERQNAWDNAAEVYEERDLLVAALARVYPSHLMQSTRMDAKGERQTVICIHSPAGQLPWTLPRRTLDKNAADDAVQASGGTLHMALADLEITPNDWDGAKTKDRLDRLRRLAHGLAPTKGNGSDV